MPGKYGGGHGTAAAPSLDCSHQLQTRILCSGRLGTSVGDQVLSDQDVTVQDTLSAMCESEFELKNSTSLTIHPSEVSPALAVIMTPGYAAGPEGCLTQSYFICSSSSCTRLTML
jgi:hypothetical protein